MPWVLSIGSGIRDECDRRASDLSRPAGGCESRERCKVLGSSIKGLEVRSFEEVH